MINSLLPDINRRNFLGRSLAALGGVTVLNLGAGMVTGCGTKGNALTSLAPAGDEPEKLSWQTVITRKEEPGEPLLVTGRIFAPDGRTPVEGLTLYVYHTDARGLYSEEDGNGREPNPRLKGWMKTDRDGRYEFTPSSRCRIPARPTAATSTPRLTARAARSSGSTASSSPTTRSSRQANTRGSPPSANSRPS